MSRRQGEFSHNDYLTILSRGVCEECGLGYMAEDPWRAHHRIWIEWGLANGFSLEIIRSIANGALLHESCHNSLHTELDAPQQSDIDLVLSQVTIQLPLAFSRSPG